MIGLGLSITQLAVRQLLGGSFNPLDLFANGEPGAWYDPSDMSTLFTDAAGTTPVTAVEQPVGLILDKSRGLVVSPTDSLQGKGEFSNPSDWSAAGAGIATVSGGVATFNGSATLGGVFASSTALVVGRYYEVEFFVNSITGGGIKVWAGQATPTYTATAVGSHTYRMLCTGDAFVRVYNNGTATTAVVDNLTIREVSGAHASQTTATSRPVLSARVNQLVKTEDFTDAVWTKTAVAVTANAAAAPDSATTADLAVPTTTLTNHGIYILSSLSAGAAYTASTYAKAGGYDKLVISDWNEGTRLATFDLTNGTATLSGSGATVTLSNATITSVGAGWYRCSVQITKTTAGQLSYYPNSAAGFAGDGTSGIYIWGASLVPQNQASLPYQRVNTASDYDAGPAFNKFLRFDGIDDSLVTSTITPGTDKAQVFAGVRKLSDAAGMLAEFSADRIANNGAWSWLAPGGFAPSQGYYFSSKGTLDATNGVDSGYAPPITNVLSGIGDISGDLATLRVNGTQVAQSTADQGTGNYLAYPLYIGRRGGTSLPFNGHIHSLIVRFGPTLTAEQITQTEAYMAAKTGVTL